MTRKQLFILIGVLAFACLCLVGLGIAGMTYVGKSVGDAVQGAGDPEKAQKIASSIADYTVPEGYKQSAMDMVFYKFIVLMPETDISSNPMIMLMSYPTNSNMSEEQMQEQLQRAFARQTGQDVSMHVVDTLNVTIRGKAEKVTVLEGSAKSGHSIRQWLAVFPGKSGLAMLMIQGNLDTWNDKLVNDFVASIK